MKAHDWLTISTVALGTAALTVATLWTGPLEAGGEAHLPGAELARPKLLAHGVEMTLTTAEGRVFKAGDEPAFELLAVNTNTVPASTCVRLTVSCSSPANPLARVVPIPAVLWEQERAITLRARESKTITVSAPKKLPADKLVAVSLLEVEPAKNAAPAATAQAAQVQFKRLAQFGIVMLNFSTATSASPPVHLVTAR